MDLYDAFSLCALAVFLIVFIGRTVSLSRRGVRVFVIGAGKTGMRALIEIGAVVILIAFVLNIIIHGLHLAIMSAGWKAVLFSLDGARITGAVLTAFGLFVFIWAIFSFGASWRIGIDKERADKLVTRGVFALMRNPIFFFIDLFFIGEFLIYPTLPFLMMAVVFVVGVHDHILEEERFLRARYGAEYEVYTKRVKRYGLF